MIFFFDHFSTAEQFFLLFQLFTGDHFINSSEFTDIHVH